MSLDMNFYDKNNSWDVGNALWIYSCGLSSILEISLWRRKFSLTLLIYRRKSQFTGGSFQAALGGFFLINPIHTTKQKFYQDEGQTSFKPGLYRNYCHDVDGILCIMQIKVTTSLKKMAAIFLSLTLEFQAEGEGGINGEAGKLRPK